MPVSPDSRKESHGPCDSFEEHPGPHGALERPPPEDSDLRLACVRVRVVLRRGRSSSVPKQATEFSGPGESGRALEILDESFQRPAAETVLIQSDSLEARDPEFVAATRAVVGALLRERDVTNIRSPLDAENAGQISADGRSALVEFEVRGDSDLAVDKIDPILLAMAEVQAAHPEVFIGAFGDASVDKELEGAFMSDLAKAGLYSVPITLIILIVVFGALVAAGIPLLLALTAVLATFGLWAIPSQHLAERRVAVRNGAPDRARRGCRLLDVLFEA